MQCVCLQLWDERSCGGVIGWWRFAQAAMELMACVSQHAHKCCKLLLHACVDRWQCMREDRRLIVILPACGMAVHA